jgi:hypothetical protein
MDQAGLRQGLPARFCQEDYPIVVAGEFSLRGWRKPDGVGGAHVVRPEWIAPATKRFYPGLKDRVVASNLQVFGRSLASIGNFFELNRLSLVEGRKTCSFHG